MGASEFSSWLRDYGQLGWADTNEIGCGLISYRKSYICPRGYKMYRDATLIKCYYRPISIIVGKTMYEAGNACSSC